MMLIYKSWDLCGANETVTYYIIKKNVAYQIEITRLKIKYTKKENYLKKRKDFCLNEKKQRNFKYEYTYTNIKNK